MNSTVADAYGERASEYTDLLGSVAQMHGSDTSLITQWGEHCQRPILDVGCGPGHWTKLLNDQEAGVHGMDITPEFVDAARQRYPEISFEQGDFLSFAARPNPYGDVLAWYSLIHLEPALHPEAFRKFHSLLKPEGRLLLGFFEGTDGTDFSHAITRAYFWDPEITIQLLENADFTVESSEHRTSDDHRPHRALSALKLSVL